MYEQTHRFFWWKNFYQGAAKGFRRIRDRAEFGWEARVDFHKLLFKAQKSARTDVLWRKLG